MKSYGVITRSYKREREGVGTNTNNDDITRGYNAGIRDYDSITRSYRREREGVETIGLD